MSDLNICRLPVGKLLIKNKIESYGRYIPEGSYDLFMQRGHAFISEGRGFIHGLIAEITSDINPYRIPVCVEKAISLDNVEVILNSGFNLDYHDEKLCVTVERDQYFLYDSLEMIINEDESYDISLLNSAKERVEEVSEEIVDEYINEFYRACDYKRSWVRAGSKVIVFGSDTMMKNVAASYQSDYKEELDISNVKIFSPLKFLDRLSEDHNINPKDNFMKTVFIKEMYRYMLDFMKENKVLMTSALAEPIYDKEREKSRKESLMISRWQSASGKPPAFDLGNEI